MALEALVTAVSVQNHRSDLIVVTAKLILNDNSEEVVNQNFSQNRNPNNPISATRDALLEKMQHKIDDYKRETELLNSAPMSNAMDYIENNLEV